jgi:LPXTG-motif cell wall-anchored protein
MKRGVVLVALVFVAALGFAGTASAQRINTVTVSSTTPMRIDEGCFTEPTTSPGSFTFTRSSTEGALTISYHINGGPTDLNADAAAGADHTTDFADGAATATVTVHPAIGGSSATVTVIEGQGYAVGDPASGEVLMLHAFASCSAPSSTSNTLPRTGIRSTSGPLALVGVASIALGSLLLVASSRRKAPS